MQVRGVAAVGGIIPANTGRIRHRRGQRRRLWDHPREYGENLVRIISQTPQQGSSPRIRGEFSEKGWVGSVGGIIPANTGRMSTTHATISMAWDHPREYGENLNLYGLIAFSMGSSPRIRGESQVGVAAEAAAGIIPANTGRMVMWSGVSRLWRDHPREYGENSSTNETAAALTGSSPRIRGEYTSWWGQRG